MSQRSHVNLKDQIESHSELYNAICLILAVPYLRRAYSHHSGDSFYAAPIENKNVIYVTSVTRSQRVL